MKEKPNTMNSGNEQRNINTAPTPTHTCGLTICREYSNEVLKYNMVEGYIYM